MGTETIFQTLNIQGHQDLIVKLNNPLMGTETDNFNCTNTMHLFR